MSHNSNADKHLRIQVSPEVHQEIRLAATDRHKTIKQYILDLVTADTKGVDTNESTVS